MLSTKKNSLGRLNLGLRGQTSLSQHNSGIKKTLNRDQSFSQLKISPKSDNLKILGFSQKHQQTSEKRLQITKSQPNLVDPYTHNNLSYPINSLSISPCFNNSHLSQKIKRSHYLNFVMQSKLNSKKHFIS